MQGIFEIGDPNFGNLWTNIPLTLFTRAGFRLRRSPEPDHSARRAGRLCRKSSLSQILWLCPKEEKSSSTTTNCMKVAVAISQGSFSERFNAGYGSDWEVNSLPRRGNSRIAPLRRELLLLPVYFPSHGTNCPSYESNTTILFAKPCWREIFPSLFPFVLFDFDIFPGQIFLHIKRHWMTPPLQFFSRFPPGRRLCVFCAQAAPSCIAPCRRHESAAKYHDYHE